MIHPLCLLVFWVSTNSSGSTLAFSWILFNYDEFKWESKTRIWSRLTPRHVPPASLKARRVLVNMIVFSILPALCPPYWQRSRMGNIWKITRSFSLMSPEATGLLTKILPGCFIDEVSYSGTFPTPLTNPNCKCHSDIFTLQISPSAISRGAQVWDWSWPCGGQARRPWSAIISKYLLITTK